MSAEDDTTAPTRREFLAMTGVTAGIASLGMQAWAQNAVEIDVDAITNTDHATDVLVIGGGMAGLFAAVKAHDAGAATMIVSKGRLGSSGLTPFGKGFFVFDPDTESGTIDEFVEKVSRSPLAQAIPFTLANWPNTRWIAPPNCATGGTLIRRWPIAPS